MKRLFSRARTLRGGAVLAGVALAVPIGGAAAASSEYVCNDDYTECEWIEYPDPPEFEDLITDVTVSNVTVTKTGQAKVVVRVYFDDPGFGYEFDDPEVYLVSSVATYLTNWLDLEEVRPGVLEAVGYANADTQTGLWRVKGLDVWVDYDNGDYSSYFEMDTNYASFYVKRNTSLTLNASPEPVKKGKSITVSGTLLYLNPGKSYNETDAYYAAYKSKAVKIYFDPKGSAPRKYMGTATTNSKGKFSKKFTAKVDGTWSAEFAGTSTYVAKKSAGDFVDVR